MSKKIKITLCSIAILMSAAVPRLSLASTVTLTAEASNGSPYTFTISGSNKDIFLTCLNDQRQINVGESWQATAENLGAMISDSVANPTDGVLNLPELKKDAYLDSLYVLNPTTNQQKTTNQEIQDAIWSILDNHNVTTGLSGSTEDNAVAKYISDAGNFIISDKATSNFYSEFTFYAPTYWGRRGEDDDGGKIPQEFMGYKPVTPEPSSLLLMGTGLAGLAGVVRRRFKASTPA